MLTALELFVRWRRPALIILAVLALIAGYFWWEGKIEARVEARVNAEWAAKEKAISAEAEKRYSKKLEEALAKQKAMAEEDARLAAATAKWEKEHEAKLQNHISAVLSGVERLRVDIRPAADPVPGISEGKAGTTSSESEPAKTADLLPETAAAILRIAGDSARDVRDFNDLLARYRVIEAACQ